MLNDLMKTIPSVRLDLYRGTELYNLIENQLIKEVENYFGHEKSNEYSFEEIGVINLPFFAMGTINTTHLFGVDELILFSYYIANRNHYKTVADIGANVGLHSIILAKLGYFVSAYEPDPVHFKQMTKNLDLNGVSDKVKLYCNAVSNETKTVSFTRVKGNTTGNHISGAKTPYGETEQFLVEALPFREILNQNDLIKIDVEGHEAVLITSTNPDDWQDADAFLEVGTQENANAIYSHFNRIGVNIFSQKIGWKKVNSVKDIPVSHREGSIFITKKDEMSW